ncbi:MAG: energy transducer TonB [Bacteroidota bacterium]
MSKAAQPSSLYFVLALTVLLGLAYMALQWKTYPSARAPIALGDGTALLPYDSVPFIKPPEPPKPKPVLTPPVLEIVEDTEEVTETLFDVPEPGPDTAIMAVDSVAVAEEPLEDLLPLLGVEEKPVFPGCEQATDTYACFQEKLQQHIRKVFQYPESAKSMGLEGRVSVQFTIQKDGQIGGIRLRGPHEVLEAEAERIIAALPKMIPGKQRGIPVNVAFVMPIHFVLR